MKTVAVVGVVVSTLAPGAARAHSHSLASPGTPPAAARERLVQSFGRLPLYFVENRGQVDSSVAYYVQGRDTSVSFGPRGLTFALAGEREERSRPHLVSLAALSADPGSAPPRERWALRLDFVGANPAVRLQRLPLAAGGEVHRLAGRGVDRAD